MAAALLSSAYFAPIQWYQKLHRYDTCFVERCDNFVKQTYRNRCVIATANGPQALSVPIERGETTAMRDIRISDHGRWRHMHWMALCSAYGDSPFFMYYADDIRPFFERKWDYLFDFNMEITHKVCELLDLQPDIRVTETYADTAPDGSPADDFRDAIRPKHPLPDASFTPQPYYQVFASKHGFQPNLSILDLLFNMGPEGIFLL